MADIERSVEIEQIDYNVDINNVSYSIDILPQNTYTIELNKQGPQGLRGYTGNGIESYELTSTAGLIDTYTITFTDGETKTVDVTNGKDGVDGTSADITDVTATIDSNIGTPNVDVILGGTELSRTIEFDFHNLKGQPGQDGVDGVDGRDGEAATISVGTVTTGLPTDPASVTNVGTSSAAIFDFTIPKGDKGDQGVQGVKGDTGNGVSGVSLLSTVGLVDTYRMSFTNGTYFDYPVTNGQDGTGSVSDVTVNGTSVLDGTIAKINLTDYVTTNTAQTISARKTFTGEKAIHFKQNSTTDRLGFTMFDNANAEKGYLEYNPSNLVDNVPLMTLGNYATSTSNITHVGFRKYDSSNRAAYNLLAPLAANAKSPFSLSNVYKNFYLPLGFTDGNTTVLTAKNGLVNISSLLPSGSNNIFLATYGTTTYADITTAINNGKLVLCTYDGDTYYYIGSGNNEVSFVTNTVGTNYMIHVDSSDNWTNDSRTIPTFISDLTDNTSSYPIDKAESVVDNNSGSLTFWSGTKAQYDAIVTKDADTLYNITDDNTADAYEAYTKSEVDTLLNGKASIDLANVNDQAKILIGSMGMPSNKYINLTLGASGATYTAPANGWFIIQKRTNASTSQYLVMSNITNGFSQEENATVSSNNLSLYMPVKNGDTINIGYSAGGNTELFRFYYAVGSESEVS